MGLVWFRVQGERHPTSRVEGPMWLCNGFRVSGLGPFRV